MDSLTLTRPDDWHLHLRDGAALGSVLPHSVRQFARAIVMPNLKPPITNTAMARDYRHRILAALPAGVNFQPLMTLYLTHVTTPQEIDHACDSGIIHGVKLYPAGATTHSEAGVSHIDHCYPTLERMAERGLPLLVHGEATDPEVDVFEREARFIETTLLPLSWSFPTLKLVHGESTDPEVDVFEREARFIETTLLPLSWSFPTLKLVFEHITTAEAVQFVKGAHANVAATITPQHLWYNRNALFRDGLRPHHYCLPVLKKEPHRQAVLEAAVSGSPKFFLGTDSAPHARHTKETACGCAGMYSAHAALELYATVFEQAGALDRLEAFASFHGADFYGLPRNTGIVTLRREDWTVPASYPFADGQELVPMCAGETLHWKLVA